MADEIAAVSIISTNVQSLKKSVEDFNKHKDIICHVYISISYVYSICYKYLDYP